MTSTDTTASRLRLTAAAAVLAALATACGGTSTADTAAPAPSAGKQSTAATVVERATLEVGEPVPVPAEPVLTLTGKISNPNDGTSLRLGLDTLDTMGVVKVEMYEPWAKKRMTFQGVWLSDVLAHAGVQKSARGVHLTALDDYAIDLALSDLPKGEALLATRSGDGSPLPIGEGGPTRLVFTDGSELGEQSEKWIWSLRDVDVR